MAFGINDIRSQLALGGARPTLFRVIMTFPRVVTTGQVAGAKSQYMIEASSLPSSTITPIEVPYWGRKIKVAGDRTFDTWSVTIVNDEDFAIRHAMEQWHSKINSLSGNLNTTGGPEPNNYKSQADIEQYSKAGGNPIRTYRFYGMFPVEISTIDMSWASTDEIERFQVTFAYDWYEVVGGNTGQIQ